MYGSASADYITELGFIVIDKSCVEQEALKSSNEGTGKSQGDEDEEELDVQGLVAIGVLAAIVLTTILFVSIVLCYKSCKKSGSAPV